MAASGAVRNPMPNTAQLETFTAGAETSVDVAGIERQLHELWQLAAESEKDPAQRAITRACLFNLVVLSGTDAERDRATETVSTLTSRHPCRAIVLLVKPNEPDSELSASITAHCHLAGGGQKQVCCEQISIYASGESAGQVSSAVLPLLESDLPTVLWWQGEFLARPELFRRLVAVADRLIYDTSAWKDAGPSLDALYKASLEQSHCAFADLSWTRLEFWRKLTAECFDDPQMRALLNQIQSVDIVHGCGPGAGLRARLFGGWIAAQLKWTPADAAAKLHLSCREDTDATTVGLLSVELKAGPATITVRKNYGERTASAQVTMPNACGLPRKRAFWPTDDTSLLSQELDQHTAPTVYQRALAMAAQLPNAPR